MGRLHQNLGRRAIKLGALLSLALVGCAAESPQHKPDVVLITIDALRADSLRYAGYPLHVSPTFDRIASESVIFETAVASFCGTTASMASMMTGLWPSFEGITEWRPATWYGFSDLAAADERGKKGLTGEVRMLAEILAARGYHTVGFHTNPNLSSHNNFDQGFHEYFQFEDYLRRMKKDRTHRMQGHYPPAPRVFRELRRWLENDRPEGPVFLWIHLMEPHSPYLPPRPPRSALRIELHRALRPRHQRRALPLAIHAAGECEGGRVPLARAIRPLTTGVHRAPAGPLRRGDQVLRSSAHHDS